jgi:hypothetical protein
MKTKSDLQWNIEIRQSHRAVLEAIVRELEGMDSEDWTKAERNIYNLAYAELQK